VGLRLHVFLTILSVDEDEHFNIKVILKGGQNLINTQIIKLFVNIMYNFPVWWPGLKNSPTVTHACRKRRLKWVPSAWGHSWVTLSPGVINTETWSSRLGVGRWTNNPAL
jgi:hypothetical protein